jgi:hypothetical protein
MSYLAGRPGIVLLFEPKARDLSTLRIFKTDHDANLASSLLKSTDSFFGVSYRGVNFTDYLYLVPISRMHRNVTSSTPPHPTPYLHDLHHSMFNFKTSWIFWKLIFLKPIFKSRYKFAVFYIELISSKIYISTTRFINF